jgi:PTH1 family peptidyl-tRNA hydrolase
MSPDPILIIGLGNPGPEYRGTWHNLGFRVVEKLAAKLKVDFIPGKGEFLLAVKKLAGKKITLMKPTSFMNLSGRPTLDYVEAENLFHNNIMVITDDVNLPLGTVRIRGKGSDGGHKGLASVIYYLGTDNIPRMRLGIASGANPDTIRDFVLSDIPAHLAEEVNAMLDNAADAAETYILDGINIAMSRFNRPAETNEESVQTTEERKDN